MSTIRSVRRNLPYVRSEFNALIGNTSLSVKCICVTVLCSYLLSYYEPSIDALSVTPGHLLPPSFWIWTLFTNPFLEIHLWEVLIDIVTVGLCGKLIEPLWGTREMLYFFGIVNLSAAILSVGYYLFLYAVTFDPSILFEVKIHGLSGYVAAVSVAVRQIMPDHVLFRTPIGKITNRNVPLTVFLLSIIMWAIGLLEGSYCTMFLSGIITSWVYLRFYQKHSNGGKGDAADSFTFASFFPNVLQPPISVVANSVFQFLVKVGVCRKQVKRFSESSGPSSINISIPGSDPHDAERRKQKALKLLNERLGTKDRDREDRRTLISPAESLIDVSHSPSDISSMHMHKSHSAGSSLHAQSSMAMTSGLPPSALTLNPSTSTSAATATSLASELTSSQKKGDVIIPFSGSV